jgi:uncharacterized protein YktA (UPF0223 family)
MNTNELVQAINQYGFPIIAAMGLGYFVYYIWQWATQEIKPVLGEASSTLIKLVDRVRMLDNDLIRLNTKLSMVLEYRQEIEAAATLKEKQDLEELLHKYKSFSKVFDSTGNTPKKDEPKKDDSKK